MFDARDLAQSAHSGKLDLLCPHMQLVVCPHYHDVVMEGSGVIRSKSDGSLHFRLVGSVSLPIPQPLLSYRPHGETYDIDDHVMLIATDAYGREWRSNPLLIHMDHPAELRYGVVSRGVEHLGHYYTRPKDDTSRIALRFIPPAQFPFDGHTKEEAFAGEELVRGQWSIDHHKRRIGEADVEFRREQGNWLSVMATSHQTFMPDWAGFMATAISFAAAQTYRPSTIVREFEDCVHAYLLSVNPRLRGRLMERPIPGLGSEHSESFWSLTEAFHLALDNGVLPHEVASELQAIRGASLIDIETASLSLAVGVEAIAKAVLPASPPARWDPDATQCLIEHVSSWEGDSTLRKSATAWLRSRGSSRPIDRLHVWADMENIDRGLIRAWKKLRNSRAHGTVLDQSETYQLYNTTLELLYRLIATSINYSGDMLELSKSGWGLSE